MLLKREEALFLFLDQFVLVCLAETHAELVCLVCWRMCSVQHVDVAADGRSMHPNLPDRMIVDHKNLDEQESDSSLPSIAYPDFPLH